MLNSIMSVFICLVNNFSVVAWPHLFAAGARGSGWQNDARAAEHPTRAPADSPRAEMDAGTKAQQRSEAKPVVHVNVFSGRIIHRD
jgi:hypothetical protein